MNTSCSNCHKPKEECRHGNGGAMCNCIYKKLDNPAPTSDWEGDKVIGVSQWREYGEKYGYWGYFQAQIDDNGKSWDVVENRGVERERLRILEIIKGNYKGAFTDDAGHNCWYVDDLVKIINKQ